MILRLTLGLLLLLLGAGALLQAAPRAQLAAADPGRLTLAPVDRAKLQADDATRDRKLGLPLRYGVVQSVDAVAQDGKRQQGGVWRTLPDGRAQWRLEVVGEDASSLELVFARLRLPAGAVLRLHAPDGKAALPPITDADNRPDGRYRSALLPGERLVAELTLPAAQRAGLQLELEGVVYGYRDPFAAAARQKSGSCNVDVICPEGDAWREQIASVAHYTFQAGSQTFLCTGTLMATGDRAQDLATPRFSTAHHCVSTAAEVSSMVVYWGYESPTCRTPGSAASGSSLPRASNTRATQQGATLLATVEGPDFTAVELTSPVPAAAQAYWSGWDRSGVAPPGSVGIHHPRGHEKRITFNDDPLELAPSCILDGTPATTHWLIDQYERGTTEGGSSGSGLWSSDRKLFVGVLSGGEASCSELDGYDCYGRLASAWDGATPATRMRDWFDRTGGNPTSVPGMLGCPAATVALDSPAFVTGVPAGAQASFAATVAGGAAGERTYAWDVDGDGVFDRSGTASSVTLTYPRAQQTQVTVRVTLSDGCVYTASRALDIDAAELAVTGGTPQQVCGDGDAALEPGERWRLPLTVRNDGGAALPAGGRALFAPSAASTGIPPIGPNTFGYRATTSALGGCDYGFVDLASGPDAVPALATSVANGNPYGPLDDARTTQTIALGGNGFRFYGQSYTQAVMSTNGYVSFAAGESGGDFANDCNGGFANGALGPQLRPHHADLVVSGAAGTGLRYRYFASCPRSAESDRAQAQGCHVFQWSGMQLYDDSGDPLGNFEFQALAYERTGQVVYQYRSAAPDAGASATIGIVDASGDDALNVACGQENAAPAQRAVCIFDPAALPSSQARLRLESPTLALPALAPGQQAALELPFALDAAADCGAPLVLDYVASAAPGVSSAGGDAVLSTSVGGGAACQVSSACPAQIPAIATRPGFYYNPQRSGNGLANFVYGNVYGGVWYSALPDRSPTWYILNGPYADHLGVMPIRRFVNPAAPGGFAPTSSNVGTAWIAQVDADTVLQAWTLDGGPIGAELVDATPLPFANPNHSQTWYSTAESGWGLSIESLATGPGQVLEFMVDYLYDAQGTARWVLGTGNSSSGGTIPLSAYRVHCPGCPWFVDWGAVAQPAGSQTISYTGPVNALFSSQITLPAPLQGTWVRTDLPLTTIGPPAPPGQ